MRQEVTELEEGVAGLRLGRACAALGVGGLAVILATLPALVALGWVPALDAPLAARAAAGVAAVVAGAKLAAMAWGLAARFARRPRLRVVAASID